MRPRPLTHSGQPHSPAGPDHAYHHRRRHNTRRYRLAGHEVTVAADYDLVEDQIVLDQVASSHELRRLAASAVAVMADARPARRAGARRRRLLPPALQIGPRDAARARSAARSPGSPPPCSTPTPTLTTKTTMKTWHRSRGPSAGTLSAMRCLALRAARAESSRSRRRHRPGQPGRRYPTSDLYTPGPLPEPACPSPPRMPGPAAADTAPGHRVAHRKPRTTACSVGGARR